MTTISVTLQLIIGYVNQFTELNMLMLHITPYALCGLPSELPYGHIQNYINYS